MSDRLSLVQGIDAISCLRSVVGAVGMNGTHPLDQTQYDVLGAIARIVFNLDIDVRTLKPLSAAEAVAAITEPTARQRLVQLMVVVELVEHPLPRDVERSVEAYAAALGVKEPMVHAAREYATNHVSLMVADIRRNGWYREEALRQTRLGRFGELVRAKLANLGIRADSEIEAKWAALAELPEGTWGRSVYDFYQEHHFPLPGEKTGIVEIGARHDWVHVLADYPPTPEGEIDVFAFMTASSDDPKMFAQFVTTLAMFQDFSMKEIRHKPIPIARADTLSDPGASDHFADALRRGFACNVDVMAIDHFSYADRLLDDVRAELHVLPKFTLSQ